RYRTEKYKCRKNDDGECETTLAHPPGHRGEEGVPAAILIRRAGQVCSLGRGGRSCCQFTSPRHGQWSFQSGPVEETTMGLAYALALSETSSVARDLGATSLFPSCERRDARSRSAGI